MPIEMLKFDLPKNQSSIIKVLGVGGGGSNAVNHMFNQGIRDVDFIICNTDAQALEKSPVPNRVQLGYSLTEGRGAGNDPNVGKNAALENIDLIKEVLSKNTKMLFITAGMGGGTGTGAAPVIAETSRELGILTVGIVTIPFSFEGRKRKQQADEGIRELRNHVDTLIIICNDKLRELYGNLSMSDAFGRADSILTTAAKGIAELITVPGHVNVDFEDVKTVMKNSGVALMGQGSAEGENRALKAVEQAMSSPLLNDNSIKGAKNILLNLTSGTTELLMDEISEVTDFVQLEAGMNADIIWGSGIDESLGNKISVTLIATGFDTKSDMGYSSLKDAERPKIIIPLDKTETKTIDKVDKKEEFPEIKLVEKSSSEQVQKNPILQLNQVKETSSEPVLIKLDANEAEMSKTETITLNKAEKYKIVSEKSDNSDQITETKEDEIDSLTKAKEKWQHTREMSLKIKSPDGVDELSKIPAYKRRNVILSNIPLSSESQASRFVLKEGDDNKTEIKNGNSFLHDNVD